MTREQPTPEDEKVLKAMIDAVDSGGVPIVMIPYTGDPPDGSFYLELLREMIETSGEATGCLTWGTSDGTSGMFPLLDVDPQTGLALLITMRQSELLGPVAWIVLACDSLRRSFEFGEIDPDTIMRGDIEKMKLSGDIKVEDVLMVSSMSPDGPGYNLAQTYVKAQDKVVWGEVEDMPVLAEGAVMELMTELVTT